MPAGTGLPDQRAVTFTTMDELPHIIERIRAFRREISEIQEDNRAYWRQSTHDKLEMERYERRLERLNEIRKELPALARNIAA
jgi:DNA repair ATPase RecN